MRVDSTGLHSMGYMDDGSEGEEDDGDFQSMDNSISGGIGSKAELRKSNKPIMEKRRRARINNCLNELKAILLEAMRKDPARHSKLEKADILELTVRHLQNVQRNQLAIAMATDPTVLHRFKNGFSECATEVSRYLGRLDGVDHGIKQRLTGHLGSCVTGLQQVGPMTFGGGQAATRYSPLAMPFSIPPSPITPGSSAVAAGPDLISPASSSSTGQDFNNNRPSSVALAQNLTPPSASSTVTSEQRGSKNFELYPKNFNQRLNAAAFIPARISGGGSNRPTPPPSPPQTPHPRTVIKVPAIKLIDSDLNGGFMINTAINSKPINFNVATGTPGTTPLDFSLTGQQLPALNLNVGMRSSVGQVRIGKVGPIQKLEADSSSSPHGDDGGSPPTPNLGRDSSMWRPW